MAASNVSGSDLAGSTLSGLARRIGASPGQLALLLACLALAAYAGFFLLGDPSLLRMLIWFAGAAVVHDLVLFPVYSAADRALVAAARGHVPLINHIRVPAMGAGLTLLMFWPGIVRQGEDTHLAASGLDQSPYLGHWLGLTAVLFGISGLVYVGRVATGGLRRRRRADRAARARAVAAQAVPAAAAAAPRADQAATAAQATATAQAAAAAQGKQATAEAQAEQSAAPRGEHMAAAAQAGQAAEAQAEQAAAAQTEQSGRDRGTGEGSAVTGGRP